MLIGLQFSVFFLAILFSAIVATYRKNKSNKQIFQELWEKFLSGLIVVVFFYQTGFLNNALGNVFLREISIGGKQVKVLESDVSILYGTENYDINQVYMGGMISFWSVVPFGILIYIIMILCSKVVNKTKRMKSIQLFGDFFYFYKKKYYYWEAIYIFYRIIIIFFIHLSNQYIQDKRISLFVMIIFQVILCSYQR